MLQILHARTPPPSTGLALGSKFWDSGVAQGSGSSEEQPQHILVLLF